jgi:hypothetical protein
MKKVKTIKQWHTSKDKTGSGDYYGTGVRQPFGKIRDVMGSGPIDLKKKGKPPKSLA